MTREKRKPAEFTVTKAWDTNLEPGTWYEVSYADKPRIIAGFVFVAPFPRRLEGQIDPHELWDYRSVDGSKLPRYRKSMKGLDARKVEDLISGMNAAIDKYQEKHEIDDRKPAGNLG